MTTKVKTIEIALENELRERDFYLRQSKKTDNPIGKKMFETIAQEENDHYNKLKMIHKELESKGTWPEDVSIVVADTNIQEVLKELPSIADKTFDSTADDKEAIRVAIEFEKQAHLFYINLKNKADDKKEMSFFDHMAKIEWEHMQSLQDTLFFFENPAGWYEEKEKPHFD
ncbi:ferritin family protein [bacterium]|nr:ferritin family protein [bacterium]